jgi:hypothetical protein
MWDRINLRVYLSASQDDRSPIHITNMIIWDGSFLMASPICGRFGILPENKELMPLEKATCKTCKRIYARRITRE